MCVVGLLGIPSFLASQKHNTPAIEIIYRLSQKVLHTYMQKETLPSTALWETCIEIPCEFVNASGPGPTPTEVSGKINWFLLALSQARILKTLSTVEITFIPPGENIVILLCFKFISFFSTLVLSILIVKSLSLKSLQYGFTIHSLIWGAACMHYYNSLNK